MEVLTVGHGTLPAEGFAALVAGAGVTTVVDVRRYPGSRRHPHFAEAAMAAWLPEHGIGYRWLPTLGGRRKAGDGSPNVALRNPQFRAYADHMATDDFRDGARTLLDLAGRERVAVLCSEAVWWRCHRRLLADHLVLAEDVPVHHLFHDGRLAPHPALDEAHVECGVVVYGPEPRVP